MDAMGLVPQQHNQTRAEALLKLEVRRQVKIDEVKQAVLAEMWRALPPSQRKDCSQI